MQKLHLNFKSIILVLFILFIRLSVLAQTAEPNMRLTDADLQKNRIIIERIDRQFSVDFKNGDSLALAAYYSKDGRFGSLKGKDIVAAWGNSIRQSLKDSTKNLIFTTTAFTGDFEFMIDLGFYEFKDDRGDVKDKGRYLVVWKQENGQWKIYRDMGL